MVNSIRLKKMKIKNKESLIKFRVTDCEKQEVERKAEDLGFSTISHYLRHISLNNKIIPKADVELLFQIKKIGVNINQIAKKVNANSNTGSGVSEQQLKNLDMYMARLNDFFNHIQNKNDSKD